MGSKYETDMLAEGQFEFSYIISVKQAESDQLKHSTSCIENLQNNNEKVNSGSFPTTDTCKMPNHMSKSFSPSSTDQEDISASIFPKCNFEIIPLFVSPDCIPGKFGLQV